ncbi:MAG: malto-oligosyltrehalose synthase [Pirellulales bacterium]|nr:malto-oligosyltrehalose synthase [Pirellulales bacterium]
MMHRHVSGKDVQSLVEAVLERVRVRAPAPGATYRLQFHHGMDFRRAASLVSYLRDLGITHIYASPLLQARPGTAHGYDLCDFSRFDESLGGDADFLQFARTVRGAGMYLILDLVPNHMAANWANAWWRDVLENGPNSPHAQYFDIDWEPAKPEIRNRVLLPVLGRQYGDVLDNGELQIEHSDGEFRLTYFDHRFPLGPKTTIPLLSRNLDRLLQSAGENNEHVVELQSILTALEHLPAQTDIAPEAVAERQREKEVIKRRLRDLEAASPAVAELIRSNVEHVNQAGEGPERYGLLDAMLNEQPYRLSHWRTAADEINYRRFFDVNELAALCMERPAVFYQAHRRVMSELSEGHVQGLRIDHVDGLYAPEIYLWRLQWSYLARLLEAEFQRQSPMQPADHAEALETAALRTELLVQALLSLCTRLEIRTPDPDDLAAVFGDTVTLEVLTSTTHLATLRTTDCPLPVWVEKILGPREILPETWPISGTTGYDFVQQCTGLFLDAGGWSALNQAFRRWTDDPRTFERVARDSKALILRVAMASELQMLAQRLDRISEQHRHTRDFTLNMLRYALREILIGFPVYRIYPGAAGASQRDHKTVNTAIATARRRNPAMDATVFEFAREVLLLQNLASFTDEQRRERELFAGRFQQVTSPVMAKGVEDTAFYVHVPLAAVNEVGTDPHDAVVTTAQFHEANVRRQLEHPGAMLASSTHDSKRSEDVRARLQLLAEMPQLWRKRVQRWFRLNRRHCVDIDGQWAPSATDEYLYYQSLLGILPLGRLQATDWRDLSARLQRYMEKATHEAKQHTSWINPDERYDRAVREFVVRTLTPGSRNAFLADVTAFQTLLAPWGIYNSISQLVLKATTSGFPDFYQGQECWDFSLVDPDNRRSVDFDYRAGLLRELQSASDSAPGLSALAQRLFEAPTDDRLKLFVVWRLLALRRSNAELFQRGAYLPLLVEGAAAEHVVAFARRLDDQLVTVVVPRLLLRRALSLNQDAIAAPQAPRSAAFWGDTVIDCAPLECSGQRPGRCALSGERVNVGQRLLVAECFRRFPVAVWSFRAEAGPVSGHS